MGGSDLLDDADVRDLAMREVLCLLDDHEAARLESAFAQLGPDRQAEILDLQAAIAREVNALGEETPDRSLRYRVLARVAAAIEEDSESTAPLASIGGGRPSPAGVDSGKLPGISSAPLSDGRSSSIRQGRFLWRAAALVLGSCLVVLSVIHWQTRDELGKFQRFALGEITLDQLESSAAEGLDFRKLAESTTAAISALSGPAGSGSAFVLVETKGAVAGTGAIVVLGLPEDVLNVEVMAVDDSTGASRRIHGDPIRVRRGQMSVTAIALDRPLLPGESLVLTDLDTGRVLLRSAAVAV